jgi:LDH2 family malate/lactate/ureidoglycolate dehydrogenase
MSQEHIRRENVQFLYYSIKRVWMAAGASEEHAHYVADAITFAHKQGKLNQGLGVYEALDIALEMKLLDIKATPEVVPLKLLMKGQPGQPLTVIGAVATGV